MSADQVLRMALIKQMYGFSYRQLQMSVEDSTLLRRFARYEFIWVPSSSALQANIKAIDSDTWEAINTALVKVAVKRGIDSGKKVRIDTTAVQTPIHHPTDSSLLWDGVRVLTRLMEDVRERFPRIAFPFHNRTRVCKQLHVEIAAAKSMEAAVPAYRRMVKLAEEVVGYATGAVQALRAADKALLEPGLWAGELQHYLELVRKIIDQTKRRVLKGEQVPAEDKIVSLFEEHTDIIEKGGRETEFGHKLCLTIGDSALILDCQILEGNPADAEIFMDALNCLRGKYHRIPAAVATDKGFGSAENAQAARALGVEALTFSRRRLAAAAQDLVASGRTERMLMRFRAGAEAIISAAKRGVNLARCLWRGWEGYCSYVWSAITAHNLKMIVAALR
jgi:IS5 family transposase